MKTLITTISLVTSLALTGFASQHVLAQEIENDIQALSEEHNDSTGGTDYGDLPEGSETPDESETPDDSETPQSNEEAN